MKLRNKFEIAIDKQLRSAKAKFKYESEKIPYVFAGHYIPDFVLETKSGKIYLETKGYLRPEHKRKMVAVKKLNPQLDIRIIFYREDKKNIKWAERNGFKYAVGSVPIEWLEE